MVLIWTTLIMELFLFFILKPFMPEVSSVPVVFLFLHLTVVLLVVMRYERKWAWLMGLALFARVGFMLWDIYARNIYILPHSGSDTEGYLASGMRIASDLSLLTSDIYGGLYSRVLVVLFFLGPEDRLIGQYVNILLGMTALMLSLKIMEEWGVQDRIRTIVIWIMGFFPSALIFSSILLREALISFLVICSFYYCLRWYRTNSVVHMLLAIGLILIGSILHSGVIGILVGFAFLFVFYQHRTEKLSFTVRSTVPFMMLALAVVYISAVSIENVPFLDKFAFYMDSEKDLYEMASGGEEEGAGGSAYLTGLEIDTPGEMLLYAPVKMVYFVASPLPWSWRGFNDLASFAYDGIIYLGLIGLVFLKYREHVMKSPILLGMLLMALTTVFIFGVGVDNAGTSMRHRYKIFYLLIMLAVMTADRAFVSGSRTHRAQ